MLNEQVIWGVGNDTDHVSEGPKPGTATIYFDDATISTSPTYEFVDLILNRNAPTESK